MPQLQQLLSAYRQAAHSEREKGAYFEELVRAYFRHEPSYADLYRQVWLYADWAREHGLDARDTGIDLVAKTAAPTSSTPSSASSTPRNTASRKKTSTAFSPPPASSRSPTASSSAPPPTGAGMQNSHWSASSPRSPASTSTTWRTARSTGRNTSPASRRR